MCGPALAPPGVMQERVLGDRYRLLERIGSGGMADVYCAHDTRLRRDVAVKVLRPIDGDPAFAARFRREARHAASIQHPNVATVYDFGEDGDDRYIVMELVRGDTLKDLVRRRGALSEDEALTMAERVARGLEAAHARRLVHRDLKPHNVLVGGDGQPRIVDFGIAKASDGTALTGAAAVLGTAHYFSPEQASGKSAEHRSDLYSLGVVLFELLTGRLPFDGGNPVEIAMRHVRDAPPRPSDWRPGLRRATDAVVLRALEQDPDRRFATATAPGPCPSCARPPRADARVRSCCRRSSAQHCFAAEQPSRAARSIVRLRRHRPSRPSLRARCPRHLLLSREPRSRHPHLRRRLHRRAPPYRSSPRPRPTPPSRG